MSDEIVRFEGFTYKPLNDGTFGLFNGSIEPILTSKYPANSLDGLVRGLLIDIDMSKISALVHACMQHTDAENELCHIRGIAAVTAGEIVYGNTITLDGSPPVRVYDDVIVDILEVFSAIPELSFDPAIPIRFLQSGKKYRLLGDCLNLECPSIFGLANEAFSTLLDESTSNYKSHEIGRNIYARDLAKIHFYAESAPVGTLARKKLFSLLPHIVENRRAHQKIISEDPGKVAHIVKSLPFIHGGLIQDCQAYAFGNPFSGFLPNYCFEFVEDPQPDDIIIYFSDGVAEHMGIVTQVDPLIIESKVNFGPVYKHKLGFVKNAPDIKYIRPPEPTEVEQLFTSYFDHDSAFQSNRIKYEPTY